ncbi:MAG: hypothetical protein K9N23_23390, partial [Akkermansiaceae bacterium]|nr:hypothetical protein [Akkermansiaceae bacterium]
GGGGAAGMERLLNAQDSAAEAVRGLGKIEPDEAARIFSEQSIAVANAVPKENAQAHFHDITQASRSVLTNVRQGGLQRDLTAYLNSRSGKIADLTVKGKRIVWGIDDTDKIIGPANSKVAAEQGTRWEQTKYRDIAPSFALLRHWNQIGQELAMSKSAREMIPPATTTDNVTLRGMYDNANVYDEANLEPARLVPLDKSNLAPVMVEASIYYNLATFPDARGSGTSQYNLRVCLYPRVALWNPYNVALELNPTIAEMFVNGNKDVELNFGGRVAPTRVPIPFGRGSTKMGADSTATGVDKSPEWYVGTILFSLPKTTLAAGETVVFSPDHADAYKIFNIASNTLSPNIAPDPSLYYWQDMTLKHAQKPQNFIEKPGASGESGGDNYLMALKDASRTRGRSTDNDFDRLPLMVYANTSLQAGGSDEMPVQWSAKNPVQVYSLPNTAAILPGDATPDVRTRDGFRFRWWNEDIQSNIAGSGQLRQASRHFQSAVIANWNPRAAYFCRTPWDNVTDVAPYFYGCYTRDLFDGEVDFRALAPRPRNGKMLGNPFGPPIEGTDQLVLFEVPRKETGIPSIGYLRHLKLSEFGWHPSYAIGNSLADPRTGRTTTSPVLKTSQEKSRNGWNQYLFGWADGRSGGGPDYWAMLNREILFHRPDDHFVVYDLSYEANFNLWDNYFLSTGTQTQKTEFLSNPDANPLPNGRMRLYPIGRNVERDLSDFHRAASKLMLDGGFNVHSISKEAWKAILASTGDTGYGSSDAIPFPRLLNPPEGEWLAGTPDSKEATGGFRSLSDYELDALAEQIVREVKERAPFFGLADFVNRRLVDTKHGDSGPLQAAIDAAGINSVFDARYPLDNETELPNVRFDNMSDATRLSQTLKPASTAWGIPGYLTQGDLLQVIGSTLTSRSDTFMIRAYGESVDAAGKVKARAWCEATVQRTPEPVTPDEAELNPAKAVDGRIDFGRHFKIVSFRWMSPDEV